MQRDELERYKEVLLSLRQECLEGMERISSNYLYNSPREAGGELSGYTQHMADMAADGYEVERNVKFIGKESDLLYEVEEALYRLEKGEFGRCEGCQGPIDPKRLKAVPYTRCCIECQIKREDKNRCGI